MSIAGVSDAVETAWWVTIAAGLVVSAVVWFLLEWLRRTVKAIDEAVEGLWQAGKRVAQNTATTHMLRATKNLSEELAEDAERRRALAERRPG